MTDYVKAWECIGCGKIEAPQTCIGICQDRKVELVHRYEHEETLAQLEAARRRLQNPRVKARTDVHHPSEPPGFTLSRPSRFSRVTAVTTRGRSPRR